MLDCLAGLSSKLEKVTEAEARSQQPPQPVQPSSQDSSQPMSHRENTATMSWRSYLRQLSIWLLKIYMDDLPHPLHIVRVVASIKTSCPALLGKVMEALGQVVAIHDLAVADPIGLGGVYRPPRSVLASDAWAGICPTPGSVTAGVLIVRNIVTGVDGHAHCFLVALKRVILWTPVSIDKVGITIIYAPLSRVGLSSLISCDILYLS